MRLSILRFCTPSAKCLLQLVSPCKGTSQIHVILYAKQPSFHTSTLRRSQGICAPRFGLCQGGGQSRMVRPSAPLSQLLPQLAGVNPAPPPVKDTSGQGVELLDLEQAAADAAVQLWLREVLEDELSV
jgi:hypothetical protein